MHPSTPRRVASLTALVLGGLLLLAGMAAAQPPGYGEGGPAVSLSASATADSITATGTGFEEGEPVTATVFSRPVVLGTKDADSTGSVTFTFSVRDLEPGEHRIVLDAPSGSASAVFTVLVGARGGGAPSARIDDGGYQLGSYQSGGYRSGGSESGGYQSGGYQSGGELAYTGSDLVVPLGVAGLVLVLGGAAAVVAGRRKREHGTGRR